MNLIGEMDTEKSNQIQMIKTKYRVASLTWGSKERFVIRGEFRKISSCLTDLRLRMERRGGRLGEKVLWRVRTTCTKV